MGYLVFKALLSGLLVVAVSELAKRSPAVGALVASLPLVSLLAIVWLWRDTADRARIADHAEATFWYVLPSLPMFLVLPAMLRQGVGFWPALTVACLLTVVLYGLTALVASRFGVRL
jgi:hypothetical protein